MPPYRDNPFDDRARTQDPFNPTGAPSSSRAMLQPPSGANQPGQYNNLPNARSSENLLNSGGEKTYPFVVAGTGAAASGGPRGARNTADALWSSDPAPIGSYEMHNLTQQKYDAWGQPKSYRKKWTVVAVVVLVASLALGGVIAGIVLAIKKNTRATSSSSSSSISGGSSGVSQTNPNDPSQFTKNPSFHQSFYGMAYTPIGSLPPSCGNTLTDVIYDIQIMSQLTKKVRLYGADCNVSALVLEAIKQTKVDMQVYLGNYVLATDNGTAYTRQRDVIKEAIQSYGTNHIAGVTVGNEFMLNYLNANGGTDPNSAIGDQGAKILIANIQDTKDMLSSMGVSLSIGTSDAGSYFNNKVLAAVDYGMANVHPWFANVSAQQSASWTSSFFQNVDIAQANNLTNNPKMYIAETGWPTDSSDLGNANNGASAASEANLQIFLDTFICQANTNGTGYFFFEYCDEPWKDKIFGGVEGWWGLFTSNRTLKNVNIPTCVLS